MHKLHELILDHVGCLGISEGLIQQLRNELHNVQLTGVDSVLLQAFQYATNDAFRINVTTPGGKRWSLDTTLSTLVKDLKAEIQTKTAIPVLQQQLVCGTRTMEDTKTLALYNISPIDSNNVVNLVCVPRPKLYVVQAARNNILDNCDDFGRIFLPHCNKWVALPKANFIGRCLAFGPFSLGASRAMDGKLYIFEPSGANAIYDSVKNRWDELPAMPTPRALFSLASLHEKFYAVGGYEESQMGWASVASAEMFDPAEGTWHVLPNMMTRRCQPMMAVVREKLYAIGGLRYHRSWSAVAGSEAFDPAEGVWSSLPGMLEVRQSFATAVLDNKICVIGGSRFLNGQDNDTVALSSVQAFDVVAGSWEWLPSMGQPRSWEWLPDEGQPPVHSAAAVLDGKLYVFGGVSTENDEVVCSAEVFDPVLGTWTDLPQLWHVCAESQSHGISSTAVVDGKLYVLIGKKDKGLPEVKVFNEVTKAWDTLPPIFQNLWGKYHSTSLYMSALADS